ncbi:MAG: arginine decarboxylase, pyruvoyl-dependent [bacterium]|nr:arginine decarboxylase, pyruvoyl-dependent [bacterium]
MTNLLPKFAFFVAGTGRHHDRLQAFDRALLSAGPFAHNLVSVSSIIPSECKIISAEEGFKMLIPGQIVFCIMARQDTNTSGHTASSAVGIVQSGKFTNFGYISEYHGSASSKDEAENIAKKLAREMFSLKVGVMLEELDIKFLDAIGASIENFGDDQWTCAVSLCVFVI